MLGVITDQNQVSKLKQYSSPALLIVHHYRFNGHAVPHMDLKELNSMHFLIVHCLLSDEDGIIMF